jgi:hypothetical protein
MHRSGTSTATRLVNLLGVPIPVEEDLLPPAFDNPRGHWESSSLVAFNDRILAARGCDWTCPARFEPGWEADGAVAGLADDAVAAFRRVVVTDEWVWKDPRNCLLLPFWIKALGTRPAVVLVLRNPLEIVASLHRRDHFPLEYCVALWDRYMRVCLESMRGLPAHVTTYDEMVADPLAWCARAGKSLGDAGIGVREPVEKDVAAFVDPALRNERVAWSAVAGSPELTPAHRIFSRALRLTVGTHHAFDPPEVPPEAPRTEELLAERRDALAALRETMATSRS